jgi:hypothetical protein
MPISGDAPERPSGIFRVTSGEVVEGVGAECVHLRCFVNDGASC